MPGARVGHLRPGQHRACDRRHRRPLESLGEAAQAAGGGRRIRPLEGRGPPRAPQLPHDRRGLDAVAHHVPHDQAQAPVAQLDCVVEVAARAQARGRQVADVQTRGRRGREARRQQRPLEHRRRVALGLVEAHPLQGQRALAGHRPRQAAVARSEPAPIAAEAEADRAHDLPAGAERETDPGGPQLLVRRREAARPVVGLLEPELLPGPEDVGEWRGPVDGHPQAGAQDVVRVAGRHQHARLSPIAQEHRARDRRQRLHRLLHHRPGHVLHGERGGQRGRHPLQPLRPAVLPLGPGAGLLLGLVDARVVDGQRSAPSHLARHGQIVRAVAAPGIGRRHHGEGAEEGPPGRQRHAHVRDDAQAAQPVGERPLRRVVGARPDRIGDELGMARGHHARGARIGRGVLSVEAPRPGPASAGPRARPPRAAARPRGRRRCGP